jgi:predicted nucleotidyltransferase
MLKTCGPVPLELLDAVVEYFEPLRVILFGSAARGDAGPDSDIDLLVILDDDAPPEKLTLAAGYQSRRSYHRAADVIPCRESIFRRKSRIAGTLAYMAAQEGRVVYERR